MTVNPDYISQEEFEIAQEEYELSPEGRGEEYAMSCKEGNHSFVAGMIYVRDEELDTIAEMRHNRGIPPMECERCDAKYIWHPDEQYGMAVTQFVSEFSGGLEEGFNN